MALESKLGLTSWADLAHVQKSASARKKLLNFLKLVCSTSSKRGSFSALKAIHKYLFDEIYDFAGELRTVNISKGNFRFAPLMYLEAALANIDKMPQSTFDDDRREVCGNEYCSPISEKEMGAALVFGWTSCSKLNCIKSLIGARSTRKIIFSQWSEVLSKDIEIKIPFEKRHLPMKSIAVKSI